MGLIDRGRGKGRMTRRTNWPRRSSGIGIWASAGEAGFRKQTVYGEGRDGGDRAAGGDRDDAKRVKATLERHLPFGRHESRPCRRRRAAEREAAGASRIRHSPRWGSAHDALDRPSSSPETTCSARLQAQGHLLSGRRTADKGEARRGERLRRKRLRCVRVRDKRGRYKDLTTAVPTTG